MDVFRVDAATMGTVMMWIRGESKGTWTSNHVNHVNGTFEKFWGLAAGLVSN